MPRTAPTADAPALPTRTCIGCTKTDTDPRHDVIVQLAPDYQEVSWHLDCHAIAGCADCAARTAGANGATGDAMRAVIIANSQEG